MLSKIIETKKQEIQHLELPLPDNTKKVSFYESLRKPNRKLGLIAEVKKASPSKGIIKEDFNPVDIAIGYEAGGADAISVLTDQQYFQGHIDFLRAIKRKTNLPVLRKDFIIDKIQIEETARIGADAMLLIGEALDANELHEFYLQAAEQGLDCLVEVHSEETLDKILSVFTPKIIGINNRNLATFETSIAQTKRVAQLVPKECLLVSESGLFTEKDLEAVYEYGANAVLVGESLMRAPTPKEGIRTLFGGMVDEKA